MTGPETGEPEESDRLPAGGNATAEPPEDGFLAGLLGVVRRTVDPVDLVGVYLRGLLMGGADAVPGVSGGTIALVTGIYERLIAAITAVDAGAVRSAWRLHTAAGRAAFLDLFERAEVPFLGALGLGVATAVVTVAQVLEVVVDQFPAVTFAAFFGLIAASAVVLYDEVDVFQRRRLAVAVVGIVAAAVVGGGGGGGGGTAGLVAVFVSGSIAISAMVLPGVSGAFLLVLLGQYEFMLGRLNAFVDALAALATGGSVAAVVDPGTDVVAFCAGAVVGLLTVAYAIRWALANYRIATLTFLVSLMVGGLRVPAERVLATVEHSPAGYAAVGAAALVGGVAVLAFDRFTDDLDYA